MAFAPVRIASVITRPEESCERLETLGADQEFFFFSEEKIELFPPVRPPIAPKEEVNLERITRKELQRGYE